MKTTTLQMRFIEAVRHKDVETARLCLEQGADPNLRTTDEPCMHPLFEAIWSDVYEETRDAGEGILALLLEYGADPNAKDRHGCSAYPQAESYGNEELCRLLQERGIKAEHH